MIALHVLLIGNAAAGRRDSVRVVMTVMVMVAVLSFAVLAVIAGAEAGARHASLEALAVVLLAARLPAVAALEVMLVLLTSVVEVWNWLAVTTNDVIVR